MQQITGPKNTRGISSNPVYHSGDSNNTTILTGPQSVSDYIVSITPPVGDR
ncbi:MAG: hypothetical protein GXY48_08655 [Methanomicrobiales archaeon]|nr:hypothetical protein [Methanomicrobiales archaeon]